MRHARADYDARIQDSARLIPDDEPVLLVRGQDACAPATVEAWLDEAHRRGAAPDVIEAVEQHGVAIRRWQRTFGAKIPDLPARPPRTRTGRVLTSAEVQRLADEAERGYAFPAAWVSPAGRVVSNEQRATFGNLDEQVAGASEWRPLYLLPEVVDAEIVDERSAMGHHHKMDPGGRVFHVHVGGDTPHGHAAEEDWDFSGSRATPPESWTPAEEEPAPPAPPGWSDVLEVGVRRLSSTPDDVVRWRIWTPGLPEQTLTDAQMAYVAEAFQAAQVIDEESF